MLSRLAARSLCAASVVCSRQPNSVLTKVVFVNFSMSVDDLRKAMDDLSDKVSKQRTCRELPCNAHETLRQFVEARENIDDAKESEGSVYYAEDLDIAIESVQG